MSYSDISQGKEPSRVLVVRLGALGDVVHALPAVTRLKRCFPRAEITWAIEPRWAPLLEGNPFVDRVCLMPLGEWRKHPLRAATRRAFRQARRDLRAARYDLAIDFQGLLKSAMVTFLSRAQRVLGLERPLLREPLAAAFYSHRIHSRSAHVVDRYLDLAAAAGAASGSVTFPLPPGKPEMSLPRRTFVLASPVAGWKSKQWPPQYYAALAALLWRERGLPLVIDCAPADRIYCEQIRSLAPPGAALLHVSSLQGLIAVTRQARAVVGVDSGPLHLAAALGVPGVALFGQTDPARNGPYGKSFEVIRAPGVETSYRRTDEIHPSMAAIRPEQVWQALDPRLALEVRSAVEEHGVA